MSQRRPDDDLRKTREELKKPTGLIDGKNWLDHKGKQNRRIDEMLLIGATELDIARDLIQKGLFKKDLPTAIKRVKRHLDHLGKEEHKLPLKQDINDVWRFDVGGEVEESLRRSIIKESILSQDISLPTRTDVEFAESQLRQLPGEVIDIEAVLDQIETNFKKAEKLLKENWRCLTKRNIEKWFSKKEMG